MRIEITGVQELKRTLAALGNKADDGTKAALFTEAERIMGQSRPEVPVDSGVLRGSGHVSLPQRTASGVEVSFGYGGAAQAYARPQHERTDYTHTVGKAHFLSDPVQRAASGLAGRLAATLRRFLT